MTRLSPKDGRCKWDAFLEVVILYIAMLIYRKLNIGIHNLTKTLVFIFLFELNLFYTLIYLIMGHLNLPRLFLRYDNVFPFDLCYPKSQSHCNF